MSSPLSPKGLFTLAALIGVSVWCALVWHDARRIETLAPDLSDAAMTAQLDHILDDAMARYEITGAVAGVRRDGHWIWRGTAGLADAQGRQVDAATAFNLASISKPLTVWTVMALVEAGRVDLDQPINAYLERWQLTSNAYDVDAVTVRRVLQHSAGLNVHGYGGYGPGEAVPADLIALMDAGYRVRLIAEPGQSWSYSGGGYSLLQMLVEDVTSQSLDRAARQLVFTPLGMTESGFDRAEVRTRSAAFAHRGEEIPALIDVALAAAGGWASARDIERFLTAHDNGAGVLGAQSVAALLSPAETSGRYAMSYTRQQTPSGWLYGHGGNNSTWHGQIYVRPQTGDAFYFLTNTTTGAQLDIDLSCAWLSWARQARAEDVCAGALQIAHTLSWAAALTGTLAILIGLRLAWRLASHRVQLQVLPRGHRWWGLTARVIGAVLCVFLAAGLVSISWFEWIYWRSDVHFIDEIPFDELEWLLPALPVLFSLTGLNLWASPAIRPG